MTISQLVVTLGLCFWLVGGSVLNLRQINHALAEGTGYYNNATWTRSETLQYIRQLPLDGAAVHSNAPSILYIHIGKSATYYTLPAAISPEALSVEGSCEAFLQNWFYHRLAPVVEDVYVVWFHNWSANDPNYSVSDLRKLPGLEVIAELSDGVILKVNKAYSTTEGKLAIISATSQLPSNYLLDALTGLRAVGSDGAITLYWNDSGDTTIAGYQFRVRASYEDDWRPWFTLYAHLATCYRLRGLENGFRYQIQLRAINNIGKGEASETSAKPTSSAIGGNDRRR